MLKEKIESKIQYLQDVLDRKVGNISSHEHLLTLQGELKAYKEMLNYIGEGNA